MGWDYVKKSGTAELLRRQKYGSSKEESEKVGVSRLSAWARPLPDWNRTREALQKSCLCSRGSLWCCSFGSTPDHQLFTRVGNRTFWKCAIALNMQKSAILKFAHFLHIRSFWKSDCAIAHFAAHLKIAKKCANAHLQILCKQQNVQSHNYTFLKSNQICNRLFSFFKEQKCELC